MCPRYCRPNYPAELPRSPEPHRSQRMRRRNRLPTHRRPVNPPQRNPLHRGSRSTYCQRGFCFLAFNSEFATVRITFRWRISRSGSRSILTWEDGEIPSRTRRCNGRISSKRSIVPQPLSILTSTGRPPEITSNVLSQKTCLKGPRSTSSSAVFRSVLAN